MNDMNEYPLTFSVARNTIVYGGAHTFNLAPLTRGVAYVQNGFFIFMGAHASGLRGIAPGISFTQKAEGTLQGWVSKVFEAQEIRAMARRPGDCSQLLWRPGMDARDDILKYLVPDVSMINESGVALSLLLSRFDDVAQFIQPDARNLSVFSHQLRELLILACTEVETSLRGVLASADPSMNSESRLTTSDFYKLCEPLHLREFSLELRHYPSLPKLRPFLNWDKTKPTKSLGWYDAYNAVKHDRANAIHKATLKHCIEALAAAVAVYCAQFCIPVQGDWMHDPGFELNDWFKVELVDPDPTLFYIPPVKIPSGRPSELWPFDGRSTDTWRPHAPRL